MSQFIFPPLTASLDSEASSGAALPSAQMIVGGFFSGTSVVYPLAVDAAGQLQVDVVSSSPLPTGAATEAKQIEIEATLTNVETYTNTIQGAVASGQMQVDIVADGAGLATSAKQDTVEATLTNIETYTNTIQGAVSSTQMQVDIVADGAGLATEATLGTIDTDTGNIATSTASIATSTASVATNTTGLNSCVDAGSSHLNVDVVTQLPSGTNNIGDVDVLTMPAITVNSIAPVDFLDAGVFDSSTGTNIPAAGSAILVAALGAACTQLEVIDDIGEYMSLYTEPGGSTPGYTLKTYLPLGGGRVKVSLASGVKIKLYSETGTTISSGKIAINFLG